MVNLYQKLAIGIFSSLLLACGSSGPDKGDELKYQGENKAMDLSAENAASISQSIFTMGSQGINISGSDDSERGSILSVRAQSKTTEDCESSGKVTITSEPGLLMFDYDHCKDDEFGDYIDGQWRLKVSGDTSTFTAIKLHQIDSFDENDISDTLLDGLANGQRLSDTHTRITQNWLLKDNIRKIMLKAENYITDVQQQEDGGAEVLVSGRLYHSVYGYVDITTDTALHFSDIDDEDYPDAGMMTVAGRGLQRLQIEVITPGMVAVRLDRDGDGDYECSGSYLWDELDGDLTESLC